MAKFNHQKALKAGGHNHTTVKHPITKSLYHPGCPACESNVAFIKAITAPECTQEQYDAALATYRNGRSSSITED